jgi:sec-independent protein translocase protein TatC
LLAKPLMQVLPAGAHMIATDVTTPFFVPMKVTMMVAFVLALPNTLYQIWVFVAPGLYAHEKRLIVPLIVSSVLLFIVGMTFAYFLVFPVVFGFMSSVTPEGVSMMTDIDNYLSFVLGMFIAFGITFEVPVVVILLVRFGIVDIAKLKEARPYVIVGAFVIAAVVTPPVVVVLLVRFGIVDIAKLKEARPYVIVGAFVVAAVVTPPDVLSQVMLAVPLWLLFELGVVVAGWIGKSETTRANAKDAA